MRAPALYALIFFVIGIVVGVNAALPSMAFLGLAVISAAVTLVYTFVARLFAARISLCISLISAGAFLSSLEIREFASNDVSRFTELSGKTTVLGRITAEPDIRLAKTFLVVSVDSITHSQISLAASGLIRVRIGEADNRFSVDDCVRFTGYVAKPPQSRNPGSFDYQRYLQLRGIRAVCNLGSGDRIELVQSASGTGFVRGVVVPVRHHITGVFEKFLSAEHSGLMRGFLIGDVRFITRSVYDRFKDTGTLHVLAASGSNVGYVTLTIFLIARLFRLSRTTRYYLAMIGVAIFSFVAYNQPSVMRASIMAVVALLGLTLRRDNNWLNTISVAGLVILAIRPLYLYDLGTQLSFAAAFSLILFMPALEPFTPHGSGLFAKCGRYILLVFYGSAVAQLGVIPILLYHFHTVPLVSFLSNLIIVPLIGVTATIGLVLVFVSAVPYIAEVCGNVLTLAIQGSLVSLDFFDRLEIPPLQIGAMSFLMVLIYYVMLHIVLALRLRSKHFFSLLLLAMLLVDISLWKAVVAGPAGATSISILDTGRITTVLIDQANGKMVLINGGGRTEFYDHGESTVLPFLKYRGIGQLNEYLYTTQAGGNIESLESVFDGMKSQSAHREDANSAKFRKIDPVIRLAIDSVEVLLVSEPISVQELNYPGNSVQILGVDWRLLSTGTAGALIEKFHPEAVVITNYMYRYASLELVKALRVRYPNVNIVSVLEEGAIELEIEKGETRIWVAANSR